MPAPHEITPAQLARLIGTPDAPTVLDLRIDEDFDADPHLLPGSRRHPFLALDTLEIGADERIVVLCQKGRKISQGAAALLRARGHAAEVLEGGHVAWMATGLPTIRAAALPSGHLWVTRQRPKIDRIACPWLLRRFVDPGAVFLFVPREDVTLVADRFAATSFDAEGAVFAHDGDGCTFDTMLERFGLDSEPLRHMARIVRGADTNRPDLAPEVPGLLAMSLGLSRMFRDDTAQIEAGMLLYDTLYRWARDATGEVHASAPRGGDRP